MTQSTIQPPHARQEPTPTTLHGQTLEDNYRWMRDKSSPELISYLEAENAYTLSVMAPTEQLQSKLYAEMLSHIKETDVSVPYRNRGWFYYVRTVEGRQYPIHCRRLATGPSFDEGQPEEIFLDVNQLAEGQPFYGRRGVEHKPGWVQAGLLDRQHRISAVHDACSRPERRDRILPTLRSEWVRSPGRRTRRRCFIRPRMRLRNGMTTCFDTVWARLWKRTP